MIRLGFMSCRSAVLGIREHKLIYRALCLYQIVSCVAEILVSFILPPQYLLQQQKIKRKSISIFLLLKTEASICRLCFHTFPFLYTSDVSIMLLIGHGSSAESAHPFLSHISSCPNLGRPF
jgi:hypothetical protein